MTTSSGSIEASANSQSTSVFPFSNQFMSSSNSFTSLLVSDHHTATAAAVNRELGDRKGSGVPKFKSLPPPSLPISPPTAFSPFSYFSIPHGLSPAEFLDSPVLLPSSTILPSPTTGTFPIQAFNWKSDVNRGQQQEMKTEQKNYSDFSFQSNTISTGHQTWDHQEPVQQDILSSDKSNLKSHFVTTQTNDQRKMSFESEPDQFNQPSQAISENKRTDDCYNWRKYGQKQVKGSENPRSYYKCTHPNCPTKKKVERSLDGRITEIVYRGSHNHPKPESTRRSSAGTVSSTASASSIVIQPHNSQYNELTELSNGSNGMVKMDSSVATPDNSSISVGDDDFEQSSQKSKSGGDEFDEDEPDMKRWKCETASTEGGISAVGSRTVREPRVVVQTTSDIDILDDGYRWRKYGQKVVKGNPNPRSYYKCTSPSCPVRKHVERASHDPRAVITTYEGKHNHDVPAPRGSGNSALSRPIPYNPSNNAAAMAANLTHNSLSSYPMPIATGVIRPPTVESVAPYTLEMLPNPEGSFKYSGFGNSMNSGAIDHLHDNALFSRTKDEPREHDVFLESLLC